jgi:hypothetical protein
MKTKLLLTVLFIVAILWPPIYSAYLDRDVRAWVHGQGRMEDFELQLLLGAQRWVIDVPEDKNGWFLSLETESDGTVRTSGGSSVTGGQTIVLLTRRNKETKTIDYAWYQVEAQRMVENLGPETITMTLRSSGSGSVDDPLTSAGVTAVRPDGVVKVGEPIYRGGKKEVAGFPSGEKADYEVRVVLTSPGQT